MAEIKIPKAFNHLTAITSLDGRFRGRVEHLSNYFSEFATIRGRVSVEIEYLIAILEKLKKPLSKAAQSKLRQIADNFSLSDADEIWKIDEQINHDTKAVEIFLTKRLEKLGLKKAVNFLHFGLTSTDVDNTGYALALKNFLKEVCIPELKKLASTLRKLERAQKDQVMLARTHGKIAVPTTVGKEIGKFRVRIEDQLAKLQSYKMGSKMTGAIGNHNALYAAYPHINWFSFTTRFLKDLGLTSYESSTQVEPYEHKVELMQIFSRINTVIQAFDEDIWRYLALGYLSLRDAKGHVGSSTMPQKINPIGFEMSENYLLIANAIFELAARKLPTNRWQRDLTDKYLLRDVSQAFVMSILAYESTTEALNQIGFNKGLLEKELDDHWEAIAEGIQTILRTANFTQPYEKLKELTRGQIVTKETYDKFITEIEAPKELKERLRKLNPDTYTGN